MPYRTTPYHIQSYYIIIDLCQGLINKKKEPELLRALFTLPYPALPNPALPRRAAPDRTEPRRAMPRHAL